MKRGHLLAVLSSPDTLNELREYRIVSVDSQQQSYTTKANIKTSQPTISSITVNFISQIMSVGLASLLAFKTVLLRRFFVSTCLQNSSPTTFSDSTNPKVPYSTQSRQHNPKKLITSPQSQPILHITPQQCLQAKYNFAQHSSHQIYFMARGGRSHAHHHRHSFASYHHRNRRTGNASPGAAFRTQISGITNSAVPPTLINGVYTVQGNQVVVRTRLNQAEIISVSPITHPIMPPSDVPGPSTIPFAPDVSNIQLTPIRVPNLPVAAPQVITQANITVAGTLTDFGGDFCAAFTIIMGIILIFPFFFMCCKWWKKLVYPKYQMTVEFYRVLGTFLRRENQCSTLNLVVVDNAFNAEKARMLYESLSGTSLTRFTFTNLALACNHHYSQADSFISNMTPLKKLPFPTQITWDDMFL